MQNAESLIPLAPLILGQIPAVSSTELGSWLFVLACVLATANYGFTFWKNITGGLQKKQSTRDDVYTSLADCEEKHAAITMQLFKHSTDTEARFEKLRLELKEDVKGIHKRIDAVLSGVMRLEGKTS